MFNAEWAAVCGAASLSTGTTKRHFAGDQPRYDHQVYQDAQKAFVSVQDQVIQETVM